MGNEENADTFDLDRLLTDEELVFKGRLRQFVDKECMPVIADFFDRGAFPMNLIPRMAEMGLFGMHIEGYGCTKRSYLQYGLVCQELGRCDSGLRAMVSVQNSLVMFSIGAFGSETQKTHWLPRMSRGETIGCFGLSEPGFGSDPGGMETVAEKKGNGYLLNGRKMWITNGTIAHVAILWAKVEGEIRAFLVEKEAPGFAASPIQRKYAYRTSPTALLTLKDCFVPEENLLPGARGLKSVLQCLNSARYGVACSALGSAVACWDAARSFALKRRVFEKPIASYQLVQDRLVRMAIEITKAQLLSLHVGRALDEGRAKPALISMAKLNNVREAMKIARAARDILGARGILADQHVIRHLCDLEAQSALEGTESMHALIMGRDLTGISAFH